MKILEMRQTFQQFSMAKARWGISPTHVYSPFEMVSINTGYVTMTSGWMEYFVLAINHFAKWVKSMQ